ncbi:sn-glycerol-3-phosphate ABC transporter ATP-binding protein UgpC [Lichenihabitans sp. Uapishka_5]|uniref:ABC transporter ATP-binding protein n=1 Tax=Lichenihabitans sp. Uapishka_5 TaxID=3037302 RepID=UPI0029E7EAC9|nr:sn-glycerol-3-phosphate ABC transporter ATP-binding protein UgpC [Lichenihabitans sp. Uapishka_5]MDX7949670.1 sn-glycerol-3-phosphate ABC transporter ATP-binding protein UgpC [Lichenihabitans sp. Uapishka_5]
MGQLTLSAVRKSYAPLEIIKGVNLEVRDGEFMVFVGPSGCGKSTLLRMIAGLEEITAGDIHIDGQRVNDLPPVKRGIAMVFQSYALYPHMSVFENIAFPLRVEKLPEDKIKSQVEQAARVLHLESRLQQRPGQLSGGQRQRVAIGRAIVRHPKIFLFDEPLSNLDAALRADMRIELARLHKQLAATMIYVTHDQIEAMTMADRIVVLNGGVIAQVGAPLELYHKPADLFVATFIGNPRMNLLPVTAVASDGAGMTVDYRGQRVTLPVAARPTEPGTALTLGIRPDHVQIGPADLALSLKPTVIERLGPQTVAYASTEAGDGFCALLPGMAGVRVDEPMLAGVRVTDCHLFDAVGRAYERSIDLSQMDAGLLRPAVAA